ncbi:MAG: ABC transporter permease [Acidobacteriota bacterium]
MTRLFRWLSQVVAVTWLNLRNLRARAGASLATVVGVAGVVMVFVGVLSMAVGFRETMVSAGRDDGVIVLRGGSTGEMSSGLALEETRIISDAPGLLRPTQASLTSSEVFVIIDLPLRSTGTNVNVPLRGVGSSAFDVRGTIEIVEGRMFEPGRNEVIVGKTAQAQYATLDLGSTSRWGQAEWTVVGVFTAGGSADEGEVWADAKVVQPAYRRGNSFSVVHGVLDTPGSFAEFKDALTADPRLTVDVHRTQDFYAEQSELISGLITGVGYLIGALMAVGAVFGALNTMYSAVSSRAKEIATLRALGFGSGPVLISVLVESLLLALTGGLIGAVIAYLLFNGFTAATVNFTNFSQVAFAFAVTPALLVQGAVFALVMGLVGGFFPAWRAARLPVATALRRL